jgi:hypothetical protein
MKMPEGEDTPCGLAEKRVAHPFGQVGKITKGDARSVIKVLNAPGEI